jgi:PTS system nitrogen regulatory IIA component
MIRNILSPRAVTIEIDSSTKKQMLQDLAVQVAPFVECSPHDVFEALWAREKLGTTGIGNGIAIPHGKIKDLEEVQGFFARLPAPVSYEAVDDKPVDIVFVLLSPETAGADHLEALAAIAKLLRDDKLCTRLRGARDAASIYDLLMETEIVAAA